MTQERNILPCVEAKLYPSSVVFSDILAYTYYWSIQLFIDYSGHTRLNSPDFTDALLFVLGECTRFLYPDVVISHENPTVAFCARPSRCEVGPQVRGRFSRAGILPLAVFADKEGPPSVRLQHCRRTEVVALYLTILTCAERTTNERKINNTCMQFRIRKLHVSVNLDRNVTVYCMLHLFIPVFIVFKIHCS